MGKATRITKKEETAIRNRLSYIAEDLYEGKQSGYTDMHWAHNTIKKLLLIIFINDLIKEDEEEVN